MLFQCCRVELGGRFEIRPKEFSAKGIFAQTCWAKGIFAQKFWAKKFKYLDKKYLDKNFGRKFLAEYFWLKIFV